MVDVVETVDYLQEKREQFQSFWDDGFREVFLATTGIISVVLCVWLGYRFWRKMAKPWLVDHLWTPAPTPAASGGPSPGDISEMSDTAEDPVVAWAIDAMTFKSILMGKSKTDTADCASPAP